MPGTVQHDNKRIAKNTLILYFRMFFMLAVSLYTSRVVLNTLGVVDYGINNVVAGVISMLGFLTGSLGGASSRFITFNLGLGDKDVLKRTFGNIVSIHLLLAAVILIVGETIGLWFVLNKLQIPAGRMTAALWIYQFSIFSSMLGVLSVPYNAVIIAHERMGAFAYISIVDALLKLLIVYLLVVIPYDKLIVYGFLFFCIQAFDRIVYGVYCARHFDETRGRLLFERKQFKEIIGYAFWTMNGNLAVVGYTQGINILLNMFFGPVVNAARGVAVQVQGVVQNFCNNFQIALNPQLTKSYAQNDLQHMQTLLKVSSKFSFFLLFVISLPLMFEAPLVLEWWLGIVPDHSVSFLRLILCSSMIVTLSNPVLTAVHATGRIKRFQMIEGTMLLTIVPIAYLLLKFAGISPEAVFCVHIVVETITQYARVRIILPMISMKVADYFKEVAVPIVAVVILSPIAPLFVYLNLSQSVSTFFIVCAVSVVSVAAAVYFAGCSASERSFAKSKTKQIINKIKK